MGDYNYDVILNSSPIKKLIIGYNNLKSNYSESAAKEYMNLYKDQTLSFILENSEYIFTEPLYGLDFYENVIINKSIAYPKFEDELDKVNSYLESTIYPNEKKINPDQIHKLESLQNHMQNFYNDNYNKIIVSGYAYEKASDDEKNTLEKLWEAYYSENVSDVVDAYTSITESESYLSYIPDVSKICGNEYPIMKNYHKFISESAITDVKSSDQSFVPYAKNIFILNKLSKDKVYSESVEKLINGRLKNVLTGFISESVADDLNSMRTVNLKEDYFPESPEYATNHLFDNIMDVDQSADSKNYFDSIETKIYESVIDLFAYEYARVDNLKSNIIGYESVIPFDISYDNMLSLITEKKDTSYTDITNAMPKSVTTSIQTHAMDKEVEYFKKRAEKDKKKMGVVNAIKSVTAIPSHIINDIKNMVTDFDRADDARRKKYISKPGYRKKIFHNLKLAILYGATASANLLLVPAVAIIRHFSKMKDRRIRNELIREVETEIKVTDEKINDATSNSDTAQKYKLIRIKSKLEEELARIKSNSKYI